MAEKQNEFVITKPISIWNKPLEADFKKSFLFLGAGFILLSIACGLVRAQDPNAAEVLGHYKESLSWLQSVSMKVDVIMQLDPNREGQHFPRSEAHFVHRRDGSRCEWIGEGMALDDKGKIIVESHSLIKSIFTGEKCIQVSGPPEGLGLPFGAFIRSSNFEDEQKSQFEDPRLAGPLNGNIFGNSHKGVAELLSVANDFALRSGMETINGVSCYVLEGTTNYGRVTAWIAPEKGHNALKWVIDKKPTDFFNETRRSDKWPGSGRWTATLDSVEVQNIGGVFVISGGVFTHITEYKGKTTVSLNKCKRTEIDLNPDFEALGAFKLNLPDGTRVHIKEYPGVRYKWQNGKIEPQDKLKG